MSLFGKNPLVTTFQKVEKTEIVVFSDLYFQILDAHFSAYVDRFRKEWNDVVFKRHKFSKYAKPQILFFFETPDSTWHKTKCRAGKDLESR